MWSMTKVRNIDTVKYLWNFTLGYDCQNICFYVICIGGDVYVLTIRKTTHRDTGLYTCEIDTKPPSKSFHKLTGINHVCHCFICRSFNLVTYYRDKIFLFYLPKVLSSKLIAPPPRNSNQTQNTSTTTDTVENLWGYSTPSPIEHDYSSCCAMKKVKFIGFIFLFNDIRLMIFSAKIQFPVYSNFYIDRWRIDALVFVM